VRNIKLGNFKKQTLR